MFIHPFEFLCCDAFLGVSLTISEDILGREMTREDLLNRTSSGCWQESSLSERVRSMKWELQGAVCAVEAGDCQTGFIDSLSCTRTSVCLRLVHSSWLKHECSMLGCRKRSRRVGSSNDLDKSRFSWSTSILSSPDLPPLCAPFRILLDCSS